MPFGDEGDGELPDLDDARVLVLEHGAGDDELGAVAFGDDHADEVPVVAALQRDGLLDLDADLLGQQTGVDEVDVAGCHAALEDALEGDERQDLGIGRHVDLPAGEDDLDPSSRFRRRICR